MEIYDLSAKRGESFQQTILFKNEDETPMDLTGKTGKCQVRTYPVNRPNEKVELIAEITVTIYPEEGKAVLTLAADKTAAIDAGKYAYDLALVENSQVNYYIGGAFTVLPSVTDVNA